MLDEQESRTTTVDAGQLQPGLGQAFDDGVCGRTRVLIERNGVPVAAIVSMHDLDQLQYLAMKRRDAIEIVQQMRDAFKDVPDDELQHEIDKALAEVRAEMAAERGAAPRQ